MGDAPEDHRRSRCAGLQRRCGGGEQAYTWLINTAALGIRGVEAWMPEKGTEDDRRLGDFRWMVERTIARLRRFRRPRARCERRDDIHDALLTNGSILIRHKYIHTSF